MVNFPQVGHDPQAQAIDSKAAQWHQKLQRLQNNPEPE
jgi:hypothetical protein